MEDNLNNEIVIEERVKQKLASPSEMELDSFFSEGWSLFKKVTAPVAGVMVVMSFVVVIIFIMCAPFLFGFSSLDQMSQMSDPYFMNKLQRSWIYRLKVGGMGLIIAFIMAPLQAGMIKMCEQADKTGEASFGTAFSFYKGAYFGRITAVVMLIAAINMVIGFVFGFLGTGGSLLTWFFQATIAIFTFFIQPLVVFGNATIKQAFTLSFELAKKHFLVILGYGFIFGLLSLLGVFACGIGMLFTVAFLYVFYYLMYKKAVGFGNTIQQNDPQITTNWMDQPPSA